jgi:Tol biopolymer transport system component
MIDLKTIKTIVTMEDKRKKALVSAMATAVLAASLIATAGAKPAEAAFAGPNGRIAFESFRNGPAEVYTMKADGSDERRLTFGGGTDPAVSPDGEKILFERSGDIFVINADGTGQTNLTDSSSSEGDPSWSAASDKIVFTKTVSASGGNGPATEIFLMNPDGFGQARLTNTQLPGTFVQNSSPVFSPIGENKIAFASNRSGDSDVYVINTDASGMTPIAFSGSEEAHPSWSPDGKRIAYDSGDVFVMNADGSNKVRHTFGLSGSEPTFSPDGKKLAFEGRLSSNAFDRIFTMDADPSAPPSFPLTDNLANNIAPDWGVDLNAVAPQAQDDAFKVKRGKTLKVSAPGVLKNDSDGNGDSLTAKVISTPTKGTLNLAPDGSFTYKPNVKKGTDSFTYKADDGNGGTDEATVNIKIVRR